MSTQYSVIPGAEPWSNPGSGVRAKVGIVVVHGFTGNPHSTRPIGEALSQKGFAVEVIRLPGHGTHWRDMMTTRYHDWMAEAERALTQIKSRCECVLLVGLSLGGTIGLDIASRRPELCAGVVPINASVLDREGIIVKLAPILAHILPAVPASAAGLIKNDAAKPGADEHAYPWVPAKAGQSLVDQFPRIRRQLKGIKVPLLVAYSPNDHSVPCANSKAIPDLVGAGGDVTLLPLERSFHLATIDYDAELIVERVTNFADRVGKVASA
jgi:carboxylesterase